MAVPTTHRTAHWIGGEQVDAGGEHIEVVDPATAETLTEVPAGTAADVDRAVTAARAAFAGWSTTPVEERAAVVQRVSDGLKARRDEIAATITAEMGSPITFAQKVQAAMPRATSAGVAKLAGEFPWTEEIGNSLVVREPVGVVGAITPWNYPLHQIVAKVAPALVAGCTVVLKPSEVAPLTAGILAEIIAEAGVPAGRLQRRPRLRPGRRRGHGRAPGRRHDVLHRLGAGRAAGRRGRRRDDQAGRVGARRQVGQRRANRRRLRPGGEAGRGAVLHQRRADLLGVDPDAGAGRPARRGRGDGRRRRGQVHRRRPDAGVDADRPDGVGRAAAARAGLPREGRGRRRDRGVRRARARSRASSAATTSARRSSRTSPRTPSSPRRRSSARCCR